jgi:hypothetical protein
MNNHNAPVLGKTVLGVHRGIFLLGLVSFLTDLSSEMVFSVFSVFLTAIPCASVALLGLIEGMADFAASSLDYVAGFVSDIQGRSAEKTPRAPQRMMPAIKTTRATFIRRVRPTGFPPLGPSPARTTPTTRSTVSPSQAREFIGTPLSAEIDEGSNRSRPLLNHLDWPPCEVSS